MSRNLLPISTIAALALIGCNSGGQDTDPDVELTIGATSGVGGDDDTGGGGDGGGDGLDETGGEPSPGYCVLNDEDGVSGLKYQCEGDMTIDILIDGPGDQFPVNESLFVNFGPNVEGDSYENPLVMACCSERDFTAPGCDQPHELACLGDMVEQGCKSIESNLRDFAETQFGGAHQAVQRAATHKIADYVRDHQVDCIHSFIVETGIAQTPPSCDEFNNSVDFGSMLATGSWRFDPQGVVSDVQLSVNETFFAGIHPVDGDPVECSSADENDDVIFLDLDPDPTSTTLVLNSGNAHLDGPALDESGPIQGSAPLSSEVQGCQSDECSILSVATDENNQPSLENLVLSSAGPSTAATSTQDVQIDSFDVRLGDRAALSWQNGVMTAPAGSVRFVIGATALGASGVYTATNATDIAIRRGQSWSIAPFTIVHQDGDANEWSLLVEGTTWQ